jgi:acetyl-CoA acetyltransferase
MAFEDAGLLKHEVDGLVCCGGVGNNASQLNFYLGLWVNFAVGNTMAGASPGIGLMAASAIVMNGMSKYVLVVYGGDDSRARPGVPLRQGWAIGQEWHDPFGTYHGEDPFIPLMYVRHMHEFGTTPEQMAQYAVNARFNSLLNPRAAMAEEGLITVEDVLNSPKVVHPLHELECAPPCAGACAFIVTHADNARGGPNPPVYVLGAGARLLGDCVYMRSFGVERIDPRLTLTPTKWSARDACEMAGYAPRDMDLLQFHDRYPILVAACLEDAGFCKKGEGGPFLAGTDTTHKGTLPINTDGGQLSAGRLEPQQGASGAPHVVEAVRQLREEAEEEGRQVADANLCMVNVCGDGLAKSATLILGTEDTL